MPETQFTPRVFSGIQPSGGLTLGNYLGAMKRFVTMQDAGTHETVYCMVDLHAITAKLLDPAELRDNTRELCAGFIAAGIDPEKSILFNQSQVPEHTQLAWIFNCVARMGWMGRMTQWKDKAGKNAEAASLGLFAYPALMAADILIYHATHVPVGDDQKQHLELTRDIAAKFNHDYGVAFFPITEPVIEGAATRVMNLQDGTKKMSKSDPSDKTRINLTDSADAIARKIRKAKTDPDPLPEAAADLEGRPDARNLVNIYAALADTTPQQVLDQHAGALFGHFKVALADIAVDKLAPISTEMARLKNDPAEIDRTFGSRGRTRPRDRRPDPEPDLRYRGHVAQLSAPRRLRLSPGRPGKPATLGLSRVFRPSRDATSLRRRGVSATTFV
ncbi:Tryptophanyl-tRNA synthetase [Roseibacterium elongatum DSM 19469]|uniref:Tryptophan--tRNA ligase n=1 Tax=Roseicyclus elongatus DSM 19469 TaxID=1294273 RepID=W8SK22_9RHOB|nr:Tryptophanyl-tRNA synthetase [Roseibacterium elongatum DSM 19469]